MRILTKLNIDRLYIFSFIAVLVLLPWSLRLSTYAFIVTAVFGLLTTGLNEKFQRIYQHRPVFIFILFFGLYLLGLLYTDHIAEGLKSVEQKLALLAIPLITASSISFTDRQRKWAMFAFVYTNALLTVVCVVLNAVSVTRGEPSQVNFDIHTLARFTELHAGVNPIWMQFSYIAFANSIIHPTYFSIYLTLCILILFYYNPSTTKQEYLKYAVIAWFSIVIILLSSLMGIFILLSTGLLNLLYYLFKRNFAVRESFLSLAFTFTVCSLILFFPVTRFRVIQEPLSTPLALPSNPENWNSINLRFLEWEAGIEGIKNHRIIGTGTGGTLEVLHGYYTQVDLGDFSKYYNAHNQYIETYLEIGLAGFVVLILCFFIPIVYAVKCRNKLLLSLVIMICLGCLSESVLERGRGLMFYMSFVSLFMFTKNKHDNEAEG